MNLKKCLKFAVLIICLASIPFGFSACASSSSQQATSQQKVHTVCHPGFNLNTDTDWRGVELKPDIKAAAKEGARMQFAQYGMDNVPEEYLDNYVDEMLKKRENIDAFLDRAVDRKLTNALKASVKLNEKEVTLEEFNKLMGENA